MFLSGLFWILILMAKSDLPSLIARCLEILTKEPPSPSYGHHKWALSLDREGKNLSVTIIWRTASQVERFKNNKIILTNMSHNSFC